MSDENRLWKSSFETNIGNLFEELRLAVYWQRPSILFAIHRSVWGEKKAIARLKDMLIQIGCTVIELKVSQKHPSIAHQILSQVQLDNSVYFILNLDHGDEDDWTTYRALNIYRELFIEHKIKAVFWLTGPEAANIPLHAPDFWAFRHRVMEFRVARASSMPITWHSLAIWYAEAENEIELDGKILGLEKSLQEMPLSPEALSSRIQLLYELGFARWNSGQMDKSLDALTDGLDLATRNSLPEKRLRFLNARAIFHIYAGHYRKADEIFRGLSRLYKKESIPRINLGIALSAQGKNYEGVSQGRMAVRLGPDNSKLWSRLGYLYISAGKLNDALTCFQHAIQFAPAEISHHESIAVCYHLLGWTDRTLSELETINYIDHQSNILVDIYRQGIMGNLKRASEMLHVEISNRRISPLEVSRNTNLNLFLDPGTASKK